MSDQKADLPKENPGDKLEIASKHLSNVKTIAVAIISVIGFVFAAGSYYAELRRDLTDYKTKLDDLEKKYQKINSAFATMEDSLKMRSGKSETFEIEIEFSAHRYAEKQSNGTFVADANQASCPQGYQIVGGFCGQDQRNAPGNLQESGFTKGSEKVVYCRWSGLDKVSNFLGFAQATCAKLVAKKEP